MAMRAEDLPIVRKYNVRCYRQSAVHGSWEQWPGWKKDSDREEDGTVVCDLFRVSSSRVCVCCRVNMRLRKERREGESGETKGKEKDSHRASPICSRYLLCCAYFFAFHSSTRFFFFFFYFLFPPFANDELYYTTRNFWPRSPFIVVLVNSDN